MMRSQTYSGARVRASLRIFAIGKAVSAPATILLVFLLASVMSKPEYASYVGAAALLEIGVAFGTLGIEWIAQTSVAAIRVRGNPAQFRRAIRVLFAAQSGAYLAFGLIGMIFAVPIASLLSNVVTPEVVRLYSLVLMVEGPLRMLRDGLLGVLLLQQAVQISQIARVVGMYVGVAVVVGTDSPVTAVSVAAIELFAASVSLAIAVTALVSCLRADEVNPSMSSDLGEFIGRGSYRFAANAYGSFLLTLPLGTEIMTTFVARYLGVEPTAAFGFVARLMETVKRYLPMDLLYAVVKPVTIGRFEQSGRNFQVLSTDVNMMLKANLVTLGFGIAIGLAVGGPLVATLSSGNVQTAPMLLAVLLATLFGHSLRRAVELVAFLAGRSQTFLHASVVCVLVPLSLVLLLPWFPSLYVVPIVTSAIDVLFSTLVVIGIRMRGFPLAFDWKMWIRLAIGCAAGGASGRVIYGLSHGTTALALGVAAAVAAFALTILVLRVIGADDLRMVRSLARAKA